MFYLGSCESKIEKKKPISGQHQIYWGYAWLVSVCGCGWNEIDTPVITYMLPKAAGLSFPRLPNWLRRLFYQIWIIWATVWSESDREGNRELNSDIGWFYTSLQRNSEDWAPLVLCVSCPCLIAIRYLRYVVRFWYLYIFLFMFSRMETSKKQTPSEFLKQIIGRPVVVKLNSGVDYRGNWQHLLERGFIGY